jgi:hypothetical protein
MDEDSLHPPVRHDAIYYVKHVVIALAIGVAGAIFALVVSFTFYFLVANFLVWLTGHPRMGGV